MSICEDCDHAFETGEIGYFVQDDPEPGSGFWLCEDCWKTAKQEENKRRDSDHDIANA